jgi:proline iminopeptidase
MGRLDEIHVPTLVLAGRSDFLFPPESQALLAAGIPDAQLRIIERAGHNPQTERTAETLKAVADFLAAAPAVAAPAVAAAIASGAAPGEAVAPPVLARA